MSGLIYVLHFDVLFWLFYLAVSIHIALSVPALYLHTSCFSNLRLFILPLQLLIEFFLDLLYDLDLMACLYSHLVELITCDISQTFQICYSLLSEGGKIFEDVIFLEKLIESFLLDQLLHVHFGLEEVILKDCFLRNLRDLLLRLFFLFQKSCDFGRIPLFLLLLFDFDLLQYTFEGLRARYFLGIDTKLLVNLLLFFQNLLRVGF